MLRITPKRIKMRGEWYEFAYKVKGWEAYKNGKETVIFDTIKYPSVRWYDCVEDAEY